MSDYDNVAKQYSDSMSDNGDFYHRTQIDPNVYKIIGDPKGKVIYDLGCGNGYIARNFVRNGAKVFASDISSELVKLAEKNSSGLDINYSVKDALDFNGFTDNQFDVVVMNMVIHYIKNVDALFKGISRVLKKGGKMYVSDIVLLPNTLAKLRPRTQIPDHIRCWLEVRSIPNSFFN